VYDEGMNNQINYSRVRRIKNAIYTIIILLFLVPAIMLIVLGVQMIRFAGPIRTILEHSEIVLAGAAGAGEPAASPVQAEPPLDLFPVPPGLGEPVEEPVQMEEPDLSQQLAQHPEPQQEPASMGAGGGTPAVAGGINPTGTGSPETNVMIPDTGLPR